MIHIDVLTLFPEMFAGPLTESILKRAQESGALRVDLHNVRDWTTDKHHTADDTPYGGGGGMIMKVEPLVAAVEAVVPAGQGIPVILMSPQGRVFTQAVAQELGAHERIALVCGHYEGIDQRAIDLVISDEISIGDYVLTGGELAAMVIIDAVTRTLPGTLGDPDAASDDSHATGLLEGPHYTRPPEFRGLKVPDTLVSGNHASIETWRRREAIRRTWRRRPEMLETAALTEKEKWFLMELAKEEIEKVVKD
jgi:tRNA (guanine37-N1)-methyltransferase